MEEINSAYKIAMSVVVLCFIISIGLVIIIVGRAFWNKTEYTVDTAINNVGYADAYTLASKNDSVPVAAVFRVFQALNLTTSGMNKMLELHCYDSRGNEIYALDEHGDRKVIFFGGGVYGATIDVITENMDKRCRFSYIEGKRPNGTEIGGRLYAEVHFV